MSREKDPIYFDLPKYQIHFFFSSASYFYSPEDMPWKFCKIIRGLKDNDSLRYEKETVFGSIRTDRTTTTSPLYWYRRRVRCKGGDLFIGVTHVGDDAANSQTDFARRDLRFRRVFTRLRGGGISGTLRQICLEFARQSGKARAYILALNMVISFS